MNAYAVPSGGHEIAPIAQNIMSTYPTSSGASTSKLLAQARLASLLYPGEQSLSKFGWADRVKEYLAEIKLSREDYPPGVRRLSHVMTHKKGSQEWMKAVPPAAIPVSSPIRHQPPQQGHFAYCNEGRRAAFDCLEPGAYRGLRRERSREDVRCHRHRSRTPSELSFAGTEEEPQTQVQRPCQVREVRWIAKYNRSKYKATQQRPTAKTPSARRACGAGGDEVSTDKPTDRTKPDPTARYRVATRNCHSLQLPRCGGVQPLYL